MGVPTVLVARTDADSAKLITSDVDERDRAFIAPKDRTAEGFFRLKAGVETAIARGQRGWKRQPGGGFKRLGTPPGKEN